MELTINAGDITLPATLDLPVGDVRGGLVVLHAASDGARSFFCYAQLGQVLPEQNVAVLRYDRRPREGADVPLAVQAGDAMAAIGLLREHVGDVPVGLWGFSQGAWVASLAAATYPDRIAFLALVASCGVSPAAQMRFGCAEQLRRRGYGATDLAGLAELRDAFEGQQRGMVDRAAAQAVVDRFADRDWFDLVYVPRRLPDRPGGWRDMDYDPAPVLAKVSCPVLLFYGETDEWMPIDDSITAWRHAAAASGADLTVRRLPGCGHHPTLDDGRDTAAISPEYTATLLTWIDHRFTADRR